MFAAGDAAAVPDLTQPGKITPPTAQHATRQGKALGRNVAASLGYGKPQEVQAPQHGPGRRPRPALRGGQPAEHPPVRVRREVVTRAYHLYAIRAAVNRWAVSLAYLTDVFFDRSVVSVGLSTQDDAEFSTSEGIPLPKAD